MKIIVSLRNRVNLKMNEKTYLDLQKDKHKLSEASNLIICLPLEIIAERYNLPFNYMTPETKIGSFCGKPVAACIMESMKPDYEPFETLKTAVMNARDDIPNIFVCHPGYVDDYLLKHSSLTVNRTKEVSMLCNPEVRAYLSEHHVKLCSYEDIR